MASLLAGWIAISGAGAQDAPAGGAAPGGGSSFPGGTSGAGQSATTPSGNSGATSFFGTPASGSSTSSTGAPPPSSATPPAPDAGTTGPDGGTGATPDRAPATTFTVPGVYGRSAESFSLPLERLGRPRFRYTGSLSIGFDDNILQAPTKGQDVPEQRITLVIRPEIPARTEVRFEDPPGPVRIPSVRPPQIRREVVIPAVPAETQEVVIPGVQAEGRKTSIIERLSLGVDVDFASRRQFLTMKARLAIENSDQKPDQPDFTGALGLQYAYRITSRLQFSANIDAAYLTQPDLSRVDTPTRQPGGGAFLSVISKLDLSYRWTPRITTSASLSYTTLYNDNPALQNGDRSGFTLGFQGRYLLNPRNTIVGDFRVGITGYDTNTAADSSSYTFLVGDDFILNSKLRGSFLVGASVRSVDSSGKSSISPYVELNLNYKLGRSSVLQWSLHYGFEESENANATVTALRSGVSYVQYFSPRLRGTASLFWVHSNVDNSLLNLTTTDDTFDLSLGFQYSLSRRWTLSGTYSFTTAFSSNEFTEYYRNRLFLGVDYQF